MYIYEFKLKEVDYKVVLNELYGDKKYLEAIHEIFGTELPVNLTFVAPRINFKELSNIQNSMSDSFKNVVLGAIELNHEYFTAVKVDYINELIRYKEFTYYEAEKQWHSSGCSAIVQSLLRCQ